MILEPKRKIEVIFSPALFEYRQLRENYIIVIIDVLRATTSICTAFEYGVRSMIPVETIQEAKDYKDKGYIVAGERIEQSFEFADLGNGAFEFMQEYLKGKDIVHSTTNGTVAISMATKAQASEILIGAFSNLSALANYIKSKQENVLFFCSGWKNTFCIEDSVFAGALIEELMQTNSFINHNDAAHSCIELWKASQNNLLKYMERASHFQRLRKYKMDEVFDYTFTLNTCNVVPKLYNDRLKDALKEEKE
jgi:2-phosphosulfolactate phosphatase